MNETARPRCGLVGPARTRNGLGPFLASFLESAGGRVTAVAGRDPDRAAAAAVELGERLGHGVEVEADVFALAARGDLDALIIASPAEAHLAGLRAALEARLHVLCEKPFVQLDEHGQVPELLDAFASAERVVVENCVWPFALPALPELYPDRDFTRPESVVMMLSPAHTGYDMLADSLSHFLSVLQALVPVDETTRIRDLRFSDPPARAERLTLEVVLEGPSDPLRGTFLLEPMHPPPRPAWIEVDGARMTRRIRPADYAISYAGADREVSVGDPMAALVYGFAQIIREDDLERTRSESRAVRQRARLFEHILEEWCR